MNSLQIILIAAPVLMVGTCIGWISCALFLGRKVARTERETWICARRFFRERYGIRD